MEGASNPEIDTVMVRTRGTKGVQGLKGAVLVRTKCDGSKEVDAVELFQELDEIYEGKFDLPLMAYRSNEGRKVWARGQVTHCLSRKLSVVPEASEKEGKGEKTRQSRGN